MAGRSILVQLFVALSFLPGARELARADADDVLVVYPGVKKTIPGPEKPKSRRRRRTPRVGTRKTEARLSGAIIEPVPARAGGARSKADAEDRDRFDDADRIQVNRKGNALEILAPESAAGKLYTLTVLLTVRTQQFRRISRDEFGKKIQPYTTWVDLPDRETKQEITLAVALGTLPHALVPVGGEITIRLSDALRRLVVRRRRREADVEVVSGTRLRILGKTLGETEFDLRYELAGEKLEATLPVRTLEKPKVVSITVEEGRKKTVGIDEIGALFDLRHGRVLGVDRIADAAVAGIVFDAYRVQVRGLKPGKTRALLAYTGVDSGKDRKPVRCRTQVPVEITVE